MTEEKKIFTAADYKARVDELGEKARKLLMDGVADLPEDKRWFVYGRVILWMFGSFYGMSFRSAESFMKEAELKGKAP